MYFKIFIFLAFSEKKFFFVCQKSTWNLIIQSLQADELEILRILLNFLKCLQRKGSKFFV